MAVGAFAVLGAGLLAFPTTALATSGPATTGPPAPSGPARAPASHPAPAPAGAPARWAPGGRSRSHLAGHLVAETSLNWSGYVDLGGPYTAVAANWTVPAVQPSATEQASSTWVGIDGATNNTLIQAGTDQSTYQGLTTYLAWYELYPSAAVPLFYVSPGDQMQVSIEEEPDQPGVWVITLADVTEHQVQSGQVIYTGPADSAEWIEEAPSLGGAETTLADFGSVTFTGAGFTSANPAGDQLIPVAMTDNAGTILAYPGGVSGGSFTITYGTPPGQPPGPNGTLPTPVVGMAAPPDGGGYWLADAQGAVSAHGDAANYGSMIGLVLAAPITHIVATPDGGGYWLVGSDGGIFAFGDAGFYGSMGGHPLNAPVVGLAPTADGHGYWLVGSDGGIFAFGDAPFHGSMGGHHLNAPVVGMAADGASGGYWLVASDGGIFAFGAPFFGSTGAVVLNRPVDGMAATPGDGGYWFVASDGGIFAFGDAPFLGSTGGRPLNAPVVGMAADDASGGYWLVGEDGGIFAFGAAFFGAD